MMKTRHIPSPVIIRISSYLGPREFALFISLNNHIRDTLKNEREFKTAGYKIIGIYSRNLGAISTNTISYGATLNDLSNIHHINSRWMEVYPELLNVIKSQPKINKTRYVGERKYKYHPEGKEHHEKFYICVTIEQMS